MAATNKVLEKSVEEGKFREDLYYRLNVVPVFIPSLKERTDDIPILVNHFLEVFCLDMGKPVLKIDENVVEKLTQYNWPGNVRELKNVVQRMIFNATDGITIDIFEQSLLKFTDDKKLSKTIFNFGGLDKIKNMKNLEKEFKIEYIKYVRNNSSSDAEAAEKLGLAPSNFHRLCKDLGIK